MVLKVFKNIGKNCPYCQLPLHVGTKKEAGECDEFASCKQCGFKEEYFEKC